MSIRSKFGNSLSLSSSFRSPDTTSSDLLKYSPDDIAAQLTILDAQTFKCVTREELACFGWNTPRKLHLTPNVVAFTRQFNKISFWVIEEVLFADTDGPKSRGEVIAFLIKIAKRLLDLNNIHSCYAIVSALNSASIYRLNKSWHFVGKKDKATFDKLTFLFTDENNFEALRQHLYALKCDCIPYLGLYLRDLVYTDVAHPVSPGLHNSQRDIKLNKILDTVIYFRDSANYDSLSHNPHVASFLNSINYIEELQKFLEEDNFKLSQKLEPPEVKPPLERFNSQSVFYVPDSRRRQSNSDSGIYNTLPSRPAHVKCCGDDKKHNDVCGNSRTLSVPGSYATIARVEKKPFVPCHRKTKSLGTNSILDGETSETSDDILSQLKGRYLIDDSVIEDENEVDISQLKISFKRGSVNFGFRSTDDEGYTDDSDDCEVIKPLAEKAFEEDSYGECLPPIAYEGYVKRKTILKDGKKPAMSAWVRYWLVLRGSSLLYYPSRSFRGCCRSDFKTSPSKCVTLKGGWIAIKLEDDPQSMDCFTLSDPEGKTVYKFKTNTHLEAMSWCREITDAYNGCLINL
ncbi:ras-specific guanine nucleotide-releasing factor RalGPS2-like protein [Leptotrombidium deliense]|uniref:Ras-specific guanine nucleotide-releasing factor RalGPS2-like protein n=1 Tax=Leptotrombidium deliense TaxID=299467 RepID=A0A443SCV8_9ACAR|nr:ras-specific guanine nucleotide-releasing factor RalGPS2-like protein [Leptotrombidium deliense]